MDGFSAILAVRFAIDGDAENMGASLRDCGVSIADCHTVIDYLKAAETRREDSRRDAYDDGYYAGYANGADASEPRLGST